MEWFDNLVDAPFENNLVLFLIEKIPFESFFD
jgi:hypothetical protein